jgi:hypothetical protein
LARDNTIEDVWCLIDIWSPALIYSLCRLLICCPLVVFFNTIVSVLRNFMAKEEGLELTMSVFVVCASIISFDMQ